MSWQTLLAIGSGGFIGAICRVYIIETINTMHSYQIPIATIIVNILGSFLLGILLAYFQQNQLSLPIKSFLSTGMLGAFTTFSTFAIESVFLFSSIKLLLLYVSMSTLGSILFAFLAYKGTLAIMSL